MTENYILVSGNVPGAKNSLVLIKTAIKNSRKEDPKEILTFVEETVVDEVVETPEVAEEVTEVVEEVKDTKEETITNMVHDLKEVEGIDFILSESSLEESGISTDMLPSSLSSIFSTDKYQLLLLNSTYDIATDELNDQITTVNNIIKSYDKTAILAGEGPLMKDLITTSDTDFVNVNSLSLICILIIMLIALNQLVFQSS